MGIVNSYTLSGFLVLWLLLAAITGTYNEANSYSTDATFDSIFSANNTVLDTPQIDANNPVDVVIEVPTQAASTTNKLIAAFTFQSPLWSPTWIRWLPQIMMAIGGAFAFALFWNGVSLLISAIRG